jgi:hypothetical protein
MRFFGRWIVAALAVSLAAGSDLRGFAQAKPLARDSASSLPEASLPDAPDPQAPVGQTEKNPNTTNRQANKSVPPGQEQPKRILGIMPNYRAVSAGAIPPPPTPKEAFKVATENSFDYSSYAFVALTSLIAKGGDDHPDLGKGLPGYWAYTWRGFIDKTDGNYLVIWALPTVFHEDERFYAKGQGRKFYRGVYAASRVLITPNYQGHNTFNTSELLGRGVANAVSLTYYPSGDRTFSDFMEKYGYAVLRDAATNTFREFWPDIWTHVLHRHSSHKADS